MYWVPEDRVDFTEPRKRQERLPEWGGQTWARVTLALGSPSSPQQPLSRVPGTWREERASVTEQDRPQGH